MSAARPIIFWVAMLAAIVAVVVLLREILLPFVAGAVLAYLLNPLVGRIERLGMNRLLATLAIVAFVAVGIAVLLTLAIPVIVRELAYFIENVPLYVRRLHDLATDPGRPWLSKIVGEGLEEAERSVREFTSRACDWIGMYRRSVWSGGRWRGSVLSVERE